MKKTILGLLALSQVASFASGYVNNNYEGEINHTKANEKEAVVKASDATNVGVFFGPKSEAFLFSGLKFAGKNLFRESYENEMPVFYAGGSVDANVTDKFDISSFVYYTNKDNKDQLEKLLIKHQDTRGTKKSVDKLGYFGEEGHNLITGLGFEERLSVAKLNQSIGLKTDNFTSKAVITSKLAAEGKVKSSMLNGFVKHELDVYENKATKENAKSRGYGSLEAEVKHENKGEKLELTNKVNFKTNKIVQKYTLDKKNYEAKNPYSDSEEKTIVMDIPYYVENEEIGSKYLYNFLAKTENKATYKLNDKVTLNGELNYEVESKLHTYTFIQEGKKVNDSTPALLHVPTLKLGAEYKEEKLTVKTLNEVTSDILTLNLPVYDKPTPPTTEEVKNFIIKAYEGYDFNYLSHTTKVKSYNDLGYKLGNTDLKGLVYFNSKLVKDNYVVEEDKRLKLDDSFNFDVTVGARSDSKALSDMFKNDNGLAYGLIGNYEYQYYIEGNNENSQMVKTRFLKKEPLLHSFYGYTNNSYDYKVNDMLTLKTGLGLHANVNTDFNVKKEILGSGDKKVTKTNYSDLKLKDITTLNSHIGLTAKKGNLTFSTKAEGNFLVRNFADYRQIKLSILGMENDKTNIIPEETKKSLIQKLESEINHLYLGSFLLTNSANYKFNENANATAEFDVFFGYKVENNSNFENTRKFIEKFGLHENTKYETLEAYIEKTNKDNPYKVEDKNVVKLTPKASAELKFVDGRLTVKPSGEFTVKFEGNVEKNKVKKPLYVNTNAKATLNVEYVW